MSAFMRWWQHTFLEERPSIGLSFFRIAVALTTGFHVIPSFFCLPDTFFKTAFKTYNTNFFTPDVIHLVQQSPDALVVAFVAIFCISWFFFLIGYFSQISCIVMTVVCYYFYALNSFPIGTLSWDILIVTLFVMCLTPYHGDYFSADAVRSRAPEPFTRRRPFFIQSILMMQVAFMYFYTGLYKVTAQGNWWTDNPLFYLMNSPPDGVIKFFLLKDYLAAHSTLCYGIGVGITLIELSMPVLLYWRRTRLSAIYLGFLFHIILILTMDVPAIFFFMFPAQLLLFIPPEDVGRWIARRRERNYRAGRSALVYDGHCHFCRESVRQLMAMDLFGELKFVDYQTEPDLALIHPSLTKDIAHSQLHLVEHGGPLVGGFFVFRRLCFKLPMMYPLIPILYFPGMSLIGPMVYRWVSRNRYLFHRHTICQGNACGR